MERGGVGGGSNGNSSLGWGWGRVGSSPPGHPAPWQARMASATMGAVTFCLVLDFGGLTPKDLIFV